MRNLKPQTDGYKNNGGKEGTEKSIWNKVGRILLGTQNEPKI